MTSNTVYAFGDFHLDPQERRLLHNGEPVELTPKAFNILVILVQNSGHLLTKQELMTRVWPDSHVEEPNLTVTIAMLRKALGEENGTRYIETVPRQGYRFTTPVRQLIEEDEPQTPTFPGKSLRKLIVAVVLAVVGLSVVYYVASTYKNREVNQASFVASHRSIAVLGFKNLSEDPEDAWLSTAFSEWLTAELQAGGNLAIIPSENVSYMETDLSLPTADLYPRETLSRIRKNLGADLLILGSFAVSGEKGSQQIRVGVRIVNAANGQAVASRSETADKAHLLEFVGRIGAQLREDLRGTQLSPAEVRAARGLVPKDSSVARLYIEGVEKLYHFDPQGASEFLERAVRAEPDYAMAHAALARAWAALGLDTKAKEEAERAMDLASALPREQSLWIEATYRSLDKDWDKALQLYKTLCTFDPDNLQYGLEMSHAQTSAGKPEDALATLKKLRSSQRSNDPGIDLAEALAKEVLGDFQAEIIAADNAVTNGKEHGAQRLVAQALLAKGWALDNMGRTEEAIKADKEAQQILASLGDRFGVARALKNIADALDDQGKLADSVASYQEALKVFRAIGSEKGIAVTLNNMAFALKDEGNLPEAKETFAEEIRICRANGDRKTEALSLSGMGSIFWREGDLKAAINFYEQALAEYRDEGDKSHMATVLGNIALVLEDSGDLSKAQSRLDESLALYRQTGSTAEVARTLINIGELLLRHGDLNGGQSRFEEALKISRQTNNQSITGYALLDLADVTATRGDLTEAMKTEEEALALRLQMGEHGIVAESRSHMARLCIDQGRLTDAEALARQAAQQFEKEGEIDYRAYVLAILSESLFLQRKQQESKNAMELALQLSRKTEDRRIRMFIAGRSAAVSTGSAMSTEMKRLEAALAESRKYHYLDHEFELRLVLGKLELRMGKTSQGRATLSALEKEATTKGFVLISRKAAVALKPEQ